MSDEFKIVKTDIPFGSGVYAYRRGDLIRSDAVEANDWDEYVVGANTKEARAAQGIPEEEPPKTSASKAGETTTTAAGGKDK